MTTATTTKPRRRAIEVEEDMQIVIEIQRVLTERQHTLGNPVSEKDNFQTSIMLHEALRELSCRGQIYFRKIRKSMRDDAIRAKFNGQNLREVCEEFDVARSTVYRICGKQGASTPS